MRKPKGDNFDGAKPDWSFSVTDAGFDGEYAEGYRDGLKSAIQMVDVQGKVACGDTSCGYRTASDKVCKECPQALARYIVKCLTEMAS